MRRRATGARRRAAVFVVVTGAGPQVSHATRVIAADEYDAAAMGNRGACPLLAAGDLRSGRQVPVGVGARLRPGALMRE